MGSSETISTVEAAKLLRVGVQRVRQLADAGRLRLVGVNRHGHRLLSRASVEEYRGPHLTAQRRRAARRGWRNRK